MSQERPQIPGFLETEGDQWDSVSRRVVSVVEKAESETAYTNASARLLALLIEHLVEEGHLEEPELSNLLYRCGHDTEGCTLPPKG